MPLESWLPIQYELPDGALCGRPLYQGSGWQIITTVGDGRALLAKEELYRRWRATGLLDPGAMTPSRFGSQHLRSVSSGPAQSLAPVDDCSSPTHGSEALAFAMALQASRHADRQVTLHDAIYVERLGRLLPTYSDDADIDDTVMLGTWLSGGVRISALEPRLTGMLNWMSPAQLQNLIEVSGVSVQRRVPALSLEPSGTAASLKAPAAGPSMPQAAHAAPAVGIPTRFELPGRPYLEAFFNEHVIEVASDAQGLRTSRVLGPVVLHGPPGCGKTFAIDRLVAHLGWPCSRIGAATLASAFEQDAARVVAQAFDEALARAPSVLVLDGMDRFLPHAEQGAQASAPQGQDAVDLLRRMSEAAAKNVLVIGTTHHRPLIDPALWPRGRVAHVVQTEPATEGDVRAVLDKLLSSLPRADDVDTAALAQRLVGRPLADVAFVVREGARLSARAGCAQVEQARLLQAVDAESPSLRPGPTRRLGGQ